MRAGKVGLEAQDVAHLGTAPTINRLIIIADTTDVLVALGQQAQPEVLRDVGVLIFVHKDIFEPALVLLKHVRMGLKNRHHVQQQIAKIDSVELFQTRLVLRVNLCAAVIVERRISSWHLVGRQRAVFPAVDDARQHPRRPAFVVDVCRAYQLFKQTQLVVGIQNGEVRLEASQLGMSPQQLYTDRMERAQPGHPFDMLAQHRADAVLHLAGGLVGKGDGKDFIRARAAGHHQMHNTRGQGLGLARAGPRQHQNRPVHLLNRCALGRVQPIQIGLRARGHGAGG